MGDVGSVLGGMIGIAVFLFFFIVVVVINRYKRCPSNRILVIYGKVGRGRSARCIHGGGAFVWPLIQSSQFLSLQPMTIDINLTGALSKQNIRINTPSTFTVGISTNADIMLNAAERLLGLSGDEIETQAEDIILGQLRLVIATLTIEQINQDRELFLQQINENVATELNKIGLQLINVNIKDITDESSYIEAIGKKSAAEAVNKARVEVAEQERNGAIGETRAVREKEVEVASELAETEKGKKEAEKNRRIAVAQLETETASAEAKADRERDVEIARQRAETEKGTKEADSTKRVAVAEYEAQAVKGENESKAQVAGYNATLAEKTATAHERGEVAKANAEQKILEAEKLTEKARLEKVELVQREIEQRKVEIDAEAEAERIRRMARGEADATLAKYEAEAAGLKKLLQAKSEGYKTIIEASGDDPKVAATLLLLEKLETLVDKQVEAISHLKIDKITVWDSGGNGNGSSSTANFVRSFVGSLPPLQEIAKQAGIELPDYLGSIKADNEDETESESKKAPPVSHVSA